MLDKMTVSESLLWTRLWSQKSSGVGIQRKNQLSLSLSLPPYEEEYCS